MDLANTLREDEKTNQAPANQRSSLAVAGHSPGKILVVEDEESLSEILEFNLQRQGFAVLKAADGLEACRMIGREEPDLILLDIMLPLLSGWEICRMIRSHHDLQIRETPVIMLSALGSESDKLKGYDLGADLYLPKPYLVKEVILQTRQLINRRREKKQLTQRLETIQKWQALQDNWQHALFHELRNQLTVIWGMADHLSEQHTQAYPERDQFIEQISNSSHYLGSLAEHYLLIRQVEDGKGLLEPENFQLGELLDELYRLFNPLAEQKCCQLILESPAEVQVLLHPIGLKIVLASLIENALKYSLLDGLVRVTVEQAPHRLSIRICDDGPGVSAEDRDKIFEKFYRGRQQTEKTGGSGLGLYMARTLAQAMEGSLELEPESAEGCCFHLSFPG